MKIPRSRKRFETEMTFAFLDGMKAALYHFRDEDAEYNALKEFVQNMEFVTPFYELCPYFAKRKKKMEIKGTGDDLILAFFPCIYFTFQKYPDFVLRYGKMKNRTLAYQARYAINQAEQRTRFHILLYKLVVVADEKHLRPVIENPYNSATYLRNNFPPPTLIDRNRMKRGDWFVKPTAYWFFGCEPTYGCSFQNDKKKRTIAATTPSKKAGECSIERSVMSPDYARNWICDFVLGKEQDIEPHLDFGEESA